MYSEKINSRKMILTGSEYLVDVLLELDTDTIFGYPGAPILSIYNALSKTDKIKHILVRHEQGAVHAAEGYARVKNKCGIVLVTSGPGVTNTITGLMNAYVDKTPVLVIAGLAESSGQNEFQDVNLHALASSCTKKVYIVDDVDSIEKIVKKAYAKSLEYPQGPCVIGISKSILESTVDRAKTGYRLKKEIKVEAPHSCVLKTIDTLLKAKKPLIIAGGGCRDTEAELAEFVRLTHIPVVNTLMASGVADNYTCGMIGINGRSSLNSAIQEADVVLALGVRFSSRTTGNVKRFLPDSKIISINVEHNKSKNVSLAKEITGELKIVLQQMIGVIKSNNILFDIHYGWIAKLTEEEYNNIIDSDKLSGDYVLNEIYSCVKKYRPIITTDVGEHQMSAVKIFKTHLSRNFITSGGAGTMGFGFPAAIGASVAAPNALVMNITGDGSFQMNIQELGTCAEYNIPVKIVILNNSALGMVKTIQKEKYKNCTQSDMLNPDFAQIAHAYGILGYKIKTKQDLKQTLKEIFNYPKAVLLDIEIN